MNLGEFIDTYKEAIAQRVVESYPPLYRPSENGGTLPRLLRTPLGAQGDAIRGAALSLEAHRGTTVVGEMGTGKTFIGAAAAHMAGFQRILVLCPPHLVPKWKREVEQTVPLARAAIVESITDMERLRLSIGSGPLFAVMSRERAKLSYRWQAAVIQRWATSKGRLVRDEETGRAVPGPLLPRLHGADHGQGRGSPDRRRPEPQAARLLRLRLPSLAGGQVRPEEVSARGLREAPHGGLLRPAHHRRSARIQGARLGPGHRRRCPRRRLREVPLP